MGIELFVNESKSEVIELHPTVPAPPGPMGQTGPKGDPGGWVASSNIPDNTDLNTLMTPGMYFRASATGTTTALNYPVAAWAGWIEVLASTAATPVIMQRASSTSSSTAHGAFGANTWFRTRYAGVWQPWFRVDTREHEAAADPHSQYARKSVANVFNQAQRIETNGPMFNLYGTHAPANKRWWQMWINSTGDLKFIPRNDAEVEQPNPLVLAHDGSIVVGGVKQITGTGFPNGAVAAPIGSRYTDTAATNGAIDWIKTVGTGNTGWQVAYGDTGWRNIISLLNPETFDLTIPVGISNYCRWRRTDPDRVEINFLLALNPATWVGTNRSAPIQFLNLDGFIGNTPTSYRSHGMAEINNRLAVVGNKTTGGRLDIVPMTEISGVYGAGYDLRVSGTATFATYNAWPTALPGTPV